ncbi:MAG: histidinol dehydrogenase, partial [Elusimicrobiota bacterium]
DYYAGPSHTLPTAGTARFSSGLSVQTFMKKTSYIEYDNKALKRDSKDIIQLAYTEGLRMHGKSVKVRT